MLAWRKTEYTIALRTILATLFSKSRIISKQVKKKIRGSLLCFLTSAIYRHLGDCFWNVCFIPFHPCKLMNLSRDYFTADKPTMRDPCSADIHWDFRSSLPPTPTPYTVGTITCRLEEYHRESPRTNDRAVLHQHACIIKGDTKTV